MVLGAEAARFVGEWIAGTQVGPPVAGSASDTRVRRMVAACTVQTVYSRRRHLAPDAALRTTTALQAYAVLRPPLPLADHLRTVHLWRWWRQHPHVSFARGAYVLVTPVGEYHGASVDAAQLLGAADPEELMARGVLGRDYPPADRVRLYAALRVACAGAATWGIRVRRTGAEVRLDVKPIRDDDGVALGLLGWLTPVETPVSPRLMSRPASGTRLTPVLV